MARGVRVDWTEQEFNRLADLVIETVENGGTVVEACEKFEQETQSVRSVSAARFKWSTVLLPRQDVALRYKIARANGQRVSIERENASKSTSVATNVNVDDDAPKQMTQRDLIRFLRNVDIVDENANRLEKRNAELESENERLSKQVEDLNRQLRVAQTKYEEVVEERNQMVAAFNVVRKNIAGVSDEGGDKYRIEKDGTVERIK